MNFIGRQQEKNILYPENCIDESLISDDSVCLQIKFMLLFK